MSWGLRNFSVEKFFRLSGKIEVDDKEIVSYQRFLLQECEMNDIAILASDSPSAKRRIMSASGRFAAAAFSALPTSREFCLSNDELSCAVKIRFGLSQFSDAKSWCACSPVDCNHPSHFDSCVASAGLRTMRHDAITGVQSLYWQQAGCTLRRELRHLSDRKRTDLEIFTGTKTYQTDTAITDVSALTSHYEQIKYYENAKTKKHQDAVIYAGGTFYPFVLSTQGEFGEQAAKVIDLICSTAVDLRFIPDSQRLMFKSQIIRHLAVALQVQNYFIVSRMRMPNRLQAQEIINSEFIAVRE
jgi:hypothetical protein